MDRKIESALAAGQALRTIAHDIRAPLSAMQQNLELLIRESPDRLRPLVAHLPDAEHVLASLAGASEVPPASLARSLVSWWEAERLLQEWVVSVEEGLRGIIDFIDTALDVTSPAPATAVANVERTLQAALLLLRGLIGHTITVQTELEPLVVHGDGRELTRVWMNLVANALTALRHTTREPVLTIRVREEGAHAVVSIQDTGPGIPRHIRDQIFEQGVSGSGSTGIGLALVHHVITVRCAGTISFDSAPTGTTFTVTLPLATK